MTRTTRAVSLSTLLLLTAFLASSAVASPPSVTARLLAGLPVEGDVTTRLPDRTLERYTEQVNEWWEEFEEDIGARMDAWAASSLQQTTGAVFYPFAGADFPTVQRLYPNATRYILIALEPGGRMPDLTTASRENAEAILQVFTDVMREYHRRAYFITGEMLAQFARGLTPVEGISAVLAMTAERMGYEVQSIEPIRVADDGSDVATHTGDPDDRHTWRSVRITLTRRSDGATVLLDYLRLDLSDENLTSNAADAAFVTRLSANPTLVKSASYLLQYESFSFIRNAILANAPTIVQDDSGVDYDVLNEHFEVTLYGEYAGPHDEFLETLQSSLVRAYQEQEAERMPFRFGYWKDGLWCMQYAHTRRQP